MNIMENYTLEKFMDDREEMLMERWDQYKYDHHQEEFHYDNVDFFNEDLYAEMCEKMYYEYLDEVA